MFGKCKSLILHIKASTACISQNSTLNTFCQTYFISKTLQRSVVSKNSYSLGQVKNWDSIIEFTSKKLAGTLKEFTIGIVEAKSWLSGSCKKNNNKAE